MGGSAKTEEDVSQAGDMKPKRQVHIHIQDYLISYLEYNLDFMRELDRGV